MTSRPVRISCESLVKEYRTTAGRTVLALDHVSLSIYEGEFVTLVGRSGGGKSTLLRILAGIERPSSGTLWRPDNQADRVGLVFQGDSIFPWRTVEGNLTYSFEARCADHSTKGIRARELCALVGLEPETFLGKYPKELSGGEARRVAIGMALSSQASLFLLDEPTSQLDYVSRMALQSMIQRLWMDQQQTVVFVTHDIDEAILLGQRILVLRDGFITDEMAIDLPMPRKREVLAQPICLELRNRILKCLENQ
jgi:ABC-type nitrate/sulfonate/bicarbonate transport system ATPase subunit